MSRPLTTVLTTALAGVAFLALTGAVSAAPAAKGGAPTPTQGRPGYGSYLFAYIPEGGDKTCQDCHMRESGLGHDMQSYRSEVMAKKALDMTVAAPGVFWRDNRELRPKATVRVELTNRTGHGLPDG